jgi:hypothetical protein
MSIERNKSLNKKGKCGGTSGGHNNPTAGLTVGVGMKFCHLCHGAGLPETVYPMHNLASCNKKDLFNQTLSVAVISKPAAGTGRGHGQLRYMKHKQVERYVHPTMHDMIAREQICRAFHASTTLEEVC